MTPQERIARATRAQGAWDEFFAPMLTEMRDEYTKRMTDEAVSELNRERRADKVGALAVALRVLSNLEGGMLETIRDGDLARKDKLKSDRILEMTDAQQRLLKIAPTR